jgi:AICAR transformylase/IMP cyclohydrolase PurH
LITDQDFLTSCRRKLFGNKAFHVSSRYDTSIFNDFNADGNYFQTSIADGKTLRYGKSSSKEGFFFGDLLTPCLISYTGKLSYNNLLDGLYNFD